MRGKLVVENVIGVFTALVLASMGLFSVSPAMGAPSFQGLGFLDATPDDDSFSEALAVSADGSTVVGVSSSSSGPQAFIWTVANGMSELGFLELSGGMGYSKATGVSSDGTVVAGYSSGPDGTEAFRWTSAGGMVGLDDLAGGAFHSKAYGISDDGTTVVGYGTSEDPVTAESRTEAFRWTSAGGMKGLGDLPGGDFESMAYAVSADGSVVTGTGHVFVSPNSKPEAFRWEDDEMTGLGFLPDANGSYGCGISADGVTIVGNAYPEFAGRKTAVRWKDTDTDPEIDGLDTNPPTGETVNTFALDVACQTLSVGRQIIGLTEKNAVYYPGLQGAKNLFDKLDALGLGDDLTDWALERADAIANDGKTIVGTGINPDDRTEAFIATGTFGVCGFGL